MSATELNVNSGSQARYCQKILLLDCLMGMMNAGKLFTKTFACEALPQNLCDHRLFLSLGPGGAGGEASHAFGHYWFHIRGVSFIQGLGFNIEVWITFRGCFQNQVTIVISPGWGYQALRYQRQSVMLEM